LIQDYYELLQFYQEDFSENVDNVFKAVLNGIDWVTNEISSTSAWTALDALGIETLWALWTGWLSVLLTYLMSSKDEKANAIIRSLIIWWVITTSWPMLMAALTGFIWKNMGYALTGDKG